MSAGKLVDVYQGKTYQPITGHGLDHTALARVFFSPARHAKEDPGDEVAVFLVSYMVEWPKIHCELGAVVRAYVMDRVRL